MAKIGKQFKNLSAMVALILLVSIGTGLVGIVIAKPYFNITQGMNLSQVLGRSDLNSSNLTNATTPQQPVHLVDGIYGDRPVSRTSGAYHRWDCTQHNAAASKLDGV